MQHHRLFWETIMQGKLFVPPVAKTVYRVLSGEHPDAQLIMNRAHPMGDSFVHRLVESSTLSFTGRRPRPAYSENGTLKTADLDLLSFLVHLALRRSVIEIPTYTNRREKTISANERKIGDRSFGNLVGLTAHKKALSFSVRIFDQSIVTDDPRTGTETCGAYRNYMVVDADGNWYDGWKTLQLKLTPAERKYFAESGMLTDTDTVHFVHYVHPNRRQSIYGASYLLLKMLTKRLEDEVRFYRAEVRRLAKLGIKTPSTSAPCRTRVRVGAVKKLSVETMEVVLDMPAFTGSYRPMTDNVAGMAQASERVRQLTYSLLPLVRFVTRADEVAFFRFGEEKGYVAPWAQNCTWEKGYRPPRAQMLWNRMVLTDTAALRYRRYTSTEIVAA